MGSMYIGLLYAEGGGARGSLYSESYVQDGGGDRTRGPCRVRSNES